MYTIEMTTKCSMTEKQKNILMQAVKEADRDAECKIDDTSCQISSSAGLEKLSYFMGIAMGGSSSNEVIKMQLSYEKQQ